MKDGDQINQLIEVTKAVLEEDIIVITALRKRSDGLYGWESFINCVA